MPIPEVLGAHMVGEEGGKSTSLNSRNFEIFLIKYEVEKECTGELQ